MDAIWVCNLKVVGFIPQFEYFFPQCTVACRKTGLFGSLWYKMKVLRMKITYLKSTAFLFFKLSTYRYDLGLSNELLIIIIAQGAAKLWPVKVGGLKKIWPRTHSNPVLLSKRARTRQCSRTSNFERSQFCSLLSYDDEK